MVIWKDELPYIIREIDDLREVIGEDVFEQVKKFIDEQLEQSETVSSLSDEVDDLEAEVNELEGELSEVSDALEELKERQRDCTGLIGTAKDFIESLGNCSLNRDQWYYLDQLQDAINKFHE